MRTDERITATEEEEEANFVDLKNYQKKKLNQKMEKEEEINGNIFVTIVTIKSESHESFIQ